MVPFQPLLEAIGHFAHSADERSLRSALHGWGPELARLVPAIGRRLPEIESAPIGDPATDRYRLFEAVATLLGTIAASAPLLIVLDDLHWADPGDAAAAAPPDPLAAGGPGADPRRLPARGAVAGGAGVGGRRSWAATSCCGRSS